MNRRSSRAPCLAAPWPESAPGAFGSDRSVAAFFARRCAVPVAILLLGPGTLVPVAARAQGAAPPPAPIASRADSGIRPLRAATPKPMPPASVPSARLRPLEEARDASVAPGDRRIERPVAAPQLNLRLGRTPPAPTAAETREAAGAAGRRDRIDDRAARCGALADAAARAACRDGTGPAAPPAAMTR